MTDKTEKSRSGATALLVGLIVASALGLRGPAAQHLAHLSDDLAAHQARGTRERARVIVHGNGAEVEAIANRHHLPVVRRLATGAVLAANSDELTHLAADPSVDHLSGDLPVRNWMSVSNLSTAADQVRAGVAGGPLGLGAIPGVDGRGVRVAVIDSGIAPHSALVGTVVANVSTVTGNPSTDDRFGHGTHVAGIIAGSASAAQTVTPLYTGGIAPGAQLVNVRVLGDDGVGLTSDVIAGIEWAIANKARYNIRVMNLSLGHPVAEPCITDPLCEVVARAYAAGIVVVVAAGNAGKAPDGSTVLGGIMSPGNSPYAITVGALNTWGTVIRDDDTITSYSSRGPTRFDFAAKPDVAAPGHRIISLEAQGSFLATQYPFLYIAGNGNNAYMRLSGTSMATPMVSGAVALLLQGTPGLTPAQVKLALQAGATFMPDAGVIGAGAGSVNFRASRQIAQSGLSLANSTIIGGRVTNASGMAYWDAGTMINRLYNGVGRRLLSALELPLVWADPSQLQFGDLNLVGLLNPLGGVPARNLIWGEVATWTSEQQIIWGTTIFDPSGQQIIWGTSTDGGDQIIWGTSTSSPDQQ